jgi:hypothetical protein
VPTAAGVSDGEVAVAVFPVAAATVTGVPTAVPPLAQPLALVSGPQMKKLTVRVGLPPAALPVTVAWSVFEAPRAMVLDVGLLFVAGDAFATVKHSVVLPSEEAE